MPDKTSRLRIPYPIASDPIAAGIFKDLAERVDTLISQVDGGDGDGDGGGIGGPTPPILRYAAGTIHAGTVTGGVHEICSVHVPDPGYAYKIEAFGVFETGNFTGSGAKPIITARVGSAEGTVVGRGAGPNTEDWHTVNVLPFIEAGSDPTYTGGQTIYYHLTSALDNHLEIEVSENHFHVYVAIHPAN